MVEGAAIHIGPQYPFYKKFAALYKLCAATTTPNSSLLTI